VLQLIRATRNTVKGLRAATGSEQAFRMELAALALAVPFALLIGIDLWRRILLIGVVVLIMIVELLNTAVEKLADRVTRERDPEIARVKDMGSAAVGLSILLALAVWLAALAERVGII